MDSTYPNSPFAMENRKSLSGNLLIQTFFYGHLSSLVSWFSPSLD